MKQRKFKIVTDSGCDMTDAYYLEQDVTCVRLGFHMDHVDYEGEKGERIDAPTFYKKLVNGAMPTTYQVTSEQAKTNIEPLIKAGNDVLVVAFSGGLSGTAGSFFVAARELMEEYPDRKIAVVDSLCASMGEGLFLHYAIQKADEGAGLEETAQYLENLKLHVCHFFTVDNLFHLKRGGRVSITTAIVGSILKIKPIMHVDNNGKLVAIGKAMGRKKSLSEIVNRLFAEADITENDPIYISHGDCMEDVEYVKKLITERSPNTEIVVNYVGPVIGTHSGQGTVAIFCKGKKR